MDELIELITRIGTDEAPTDAELTKARAELVTLLKTATAADTRDLEAATTIREAIDKIDAETKSRVEAAAAEEETARKLLEGLEEPDMDEDADAEEADVEAKDKEPVAAANANRTSLSSALRRTSARMTEQEPEGPKYAQVVTLGVANGERLSNNATLADVAKVFDRTANRVQNAGDKQSLVRVEMTYPSDRQLFSTERVDNDRLLDAVTASAVVAAGGICDPLPADFTHPIFGMRGRPIRDALPRFQASRGGVRFSPSATLAATTTGVGVWTHETDVSPGESTKNLLVLTCEEEDTAYVNAITASVQIGNFQARFNPEFWRSRLDLLMISHDRLAEQTLYADMVAVATNVTYGTTFGTIQGVLNAIDRAAAGMRSRMRLGNLRLRLIAPEWVRNALRTHITAQRIGSNPADFLAAADNAINNYFAVRGINITWSQDVQGFSPQATGALNDFASTVELLMFPEGAFFFLDGGTLDLGTEIYDTTLVRKNNRLAFMETFEKAVYRGGEVLNIEVGVGDDCICPNVAVVE